MTGLQRSEISFRRQGSSGLVWDDKLTLEVKKSEHNDNDNKPRIESKPEITRSRSNRGNAYRSRTVATAVDPLSPKVSGCGICGIFGKPVPTQKQKSRNRKL
ncbi:unnamed protein product [Fraxinus pennsylvanica]|uniref:MAPK kinase substrate protein n=1 Tax=Fraxinus pennsylvanica TaxID=56036 RepID=A0AAD2A6S6_9LAMI|nr:unnamed protein product [Fraxinus pennsylvanica]